MNVSPRLRWVLLPLSWIYREIVRVRVWMYAKGVLPQRRVSTPVISVGNLTVGGTGKTPMVIWLAERLLAKGNRVGILTRGYKGREGTSDEIEQMKARLQARIQFGVGKNRYEQALRLEQIGVDVLLMDDGFQHLQLARDLDILLLDASQPLTNESLLPAGRLREPLSEMGRADLLVFTRTETSPGAKDAIAKLNDYPVFSAATKLLGFRRLGSDNSIVPAEQLGGGPFFSFCGIGNPQAFFKDLKNWGLSNAGTRIFPDHHRYRAADTVEIQTAARSVGAHALLTTEKDAQNLSGVELRDLPAFVAVIELQIAKEEAFLDAIQKRVNARRAAI
jgi:tetraacyldisaccharide 4'-kinase